MTAVVSVVLAVAVVSGQHGSGSGHAAPPRMASDALSRRSSFNTLGYEQLATQHVARAVDAQLEPMPLPRGPLIVRYWDAVSHQ
jgi:hypothetical protein